MDLRAGALLLLLAAGMAAPAAAQQFVTDDATVTAHRACQLEGWYGEAASWVLPACRFFRPLEITAGVGFVADEDGGRAAEYVLQGKTLFRELQPNGYGVGLVMGIGVDPLAQATGRRIEGVYAFLPLSLSLAGDRLLLHLNPGWHFERDAHDHGGRVQDAAHHAFTWAFRGDLVLTERFTLIGELFGEDRLRPEYQLGLRTILLPEYLLADLSYGGHSAAGVAGAGWAVGLAWTPPPLF
ncbi:MAG: hypothetical protein M3418_09060 [Gemmatimonadota bacterium]|nr:hypothetical protein [Gemmatimonadota bacterium]